MDRAFVVQVLRAQFIWLFELLFLIWNVKQFRSNHVVCWWSAWVVPPWVIPSKISDAWSPHWILGSRFAPGYVFTRDIKLQWMICEYCNALVLPFLVEQLSSFRKTALQRFAQRSGSSFSNEVRKRITTRLELRNQLEQENLLLPPLAKKPVPPEVTVKRCYFCAPKRNSQVHLVLHL